MTGHAASVLYSPLFDEFDLDRFAGSLGRTQITDRRETAPQENESEQQVQQQGQRCREVTLTALVR